MLARVLEDFGIDDTHLYVPRAFQPLTERLGDGQRMGKRASEGFRSLLELGIMIALRLDVIADPGFRSDEDSGIGAPSVRLRRMALQIAERGIEPRYALGDSWRIVGELDQLVPADPEVGEHGV